MAAKNEQKLMLAIKILSRGVSGLLQAPYSLSSPPHDRSKAWSRQVPNTINPQGDRILTMLCIVTSTSSGRRRRRLKPTFLTLAKGTREHERSRRISEEEEGQCVNVMRQVMSRSRYFACRFQAIFFWLVTDFP